MTVITQPDWTLHTFFSYSVTYEVDLFEVLDIMAQMWHYIISFSYKPTKVTSDFILNYMKKVIGGTTNLFIFFFGPYNVSTQTLFLFVFLIKISKPLEEIFDK